LHRRRGIAGEGSAGSSDGAPRRWVRRPRSHRLDLPRRRPSGPTHRRLDREPGLRGEAARPVDGVLTVPHLSKQAWRVLGTVLVALLAVAFWWLESGSGSGGLGSSGPPDQPAV